MRKKSKIHLEFHHELAKNCLVVQIVNQRLYYVQAISDALHFHSMSMTRSDWRALGRLTAGFYYISYATLCGGSRNYLYLDLLCNGFT